MTEFPPVTPENANIFEDELTYALELLRYLGSQGFSSLSEDQIGSVFDLLTELKDESTVVEKMAESDWEDAVDARWDELLSTFEKKFPVGSTITLDKEEARGEFVIERYRGTYWRLHPHQEEKAIDLVVRKPLTLRNPILKRFQKPTEMNISLTEEEVHKYLANSEETPLVAEEPADQRILHGDDIVDLQS